MHKQTLRIVGIGVLTADLPKGEGTAVPEIQVHVGIAAGRCGGFALAHAAEDAVRPVGAGGGDNGGAPQPGGAQRDMAVGVDGAVRQVADEAVIALLVPGGPGDGNDHRHKEENGQDEADPEPGAPLFLRALGPDFLIHGAILLCSS